MERIEINLLPAEYRIRKRSVDVPRSLVYPIFGIIVFLCAAGLYTLYLRDKETKLKDDIASLEAEIKANAHIQAEMNKLREEKKITEEKIKALMLISVNREKWVRLLEVLSGKLPSYTWLMSVKEGADNQLSVEARTYSFPEVAHYMTRLEEHEYISKVDLVGIEQVAGPEGRKVYRFSINCAVNKDAGLGAHASAPDSTAAPAPAAAAAQGKAKK